MPEMMPRRAFVTLIGGAAIWSHAALAQKTDGVRRVGVIMGFAENDEVWQVYLATFRQALQNLGWTDGRNIRFDYRFAGDSEQLMRTMAEEIVGLAPDVILVSTNSVVTATLMTPIVGNALTPHHRDGDPTSSKGGGYIYPSFGEASPFSKANHAAAVREVTPIFMKMLDTCRATVF